MLQLPTNGMLLSVEEHNASVVAVCDWIEATVLFGDGERITKEDVVDVLCEQNVYREQDHAWVFVDDIVWTELDLRHRTLADPPLDFERDGVVRRLPWNDCLGLSFCLMLALSDSYPAWYKACSPNYQEQGHLFERLTEYALISLFPGWRVELIGWSGQTPMMLPQAVEKVSTLLGEPEGDITSWASSSAKECGLDVICFRPFPDGRRGYPVFLTQCASGKNWQSKRHEPRLSVWTKLVTFSMPPQKAFAMPFALEEKDVRPHIAAVDGLLLDRHRLLSGNDLDIPPDLKADLVNWIAPRVDVLPTC